MLAANISTLGKPSPIGVVSVITFFCSCVKSIIIVRDGELVECNICHKKWRIIAEMKYAISEIIATNDSLLESIAKS